MTIDDVVRRRQYLTAMEIEIWERRSIGAAAVPAPGESVASDFNGRDSGAAAIMPPRPANAPVTSVQSQTGMPLAVPALDWQALEQVVAGCSKCSLHAHRTQTVFGVGNKTAQWLFIGEAPGAEEDRQGEPFVGRAGQLLNAMLLAIGLKRQEIYIANVLKCRPPNNRDPQGIEVECCEPYLLRQIDLIAPKIIIAMGRFAAHSLMKTDMALGKLRGRRLAYHGIPLIVTYHPAYLLRNPIDKRKAWEDLCLAKTVMEDS
jgi:DNA polymerase